MALNMKNSSALKDRRSPSDRLLNKVSKHGLNSHINLQHRQANRWHLSVLCQVAMKVWKRAHGLKHHMVSTVLSRLGRLGRLGSTSSKKRELGLRHPMVNMAPSQLGSKHHNLKVGNSVHHCLHKLRRLTMLTTLLHKLIKVHGDQIARSHGNHSNNQLHHRHSSQPLSSKGLHNNQFININLCHSTSSQCHNTSSQSLSTSSQCHR